MCKNAGLCALVGWLILTPPVLAGRYETFTKKAAAGPKMKVAAQASFGNDGIQEFVSAGQLPDGAIVAFGNAWGPSFPVAPPPLVLGRGRHRALDPYLPIPKQKKSALREDDPDVAGMIVFYPKSLATVKKVVRFGWGIASISSGTVLPEGRGLLIAGRCTNAFPDAVRNRVRMETVPADSATGPYEYAGVKESGDVFVALLPPSGDGILWAIVFQGARAAPRRLWLDYEGNIYADIRGLVRISPDGQLVTRIATIIQTSDGQSHNRTYTATRSAGYLTVDPKDGSFYFGGDRSTNTGFEPWRQPYLYKFDADGHRLWKLWDWPAGDVASGGDGINLCASSGIKAMDIAPDGALIIGAWSEGANSVFTRQPEVLDRSARWTGFGMDGAGANGGTSLSYILKVDPKRHRVLEGTLFQAYVPESSSDRRHRGDPSPTRLRDLRLLNDGSIAFTGIAGTGLVHTPNALVNPPKNSRDYEGDFVAVFSRDFQSLSFSSYLPGCENSTIESVPDGLIVVSRRKREPHGPSASPIAAYDASILLLALPSN